jgi:hypothetical protein
MKIHTDLLLTASPTMLECLLNRLVWFATEPDADEANSYLLSNESEWFEAVEAMEPKELFSTIEATAKLLRLMLEDS